MRLSDSPFASSNRNKNDSPFKDKFSKHEKKIEASLENKNDSPFREKISNHETKIKASIENGNDSPFRKKISNHEKKIKNLFLKTKKTLLKLRTGIKKHHSTTKPIPKKKCVTRDDNDSGRDKVNIESRDDELNEIIDNCEINTCSKHETKRTISSSSVIDSSEIYTCSKHEIIRTTSPSSDESFNLDKCYSTEKEDSISFQDSDFFTAFQESNLLSKAHDLVEIERVDNDQTSKQPTYKIRVPITDNKMQNTMLAALEESTIIEQLEDKNIEYEFIGSNKNTSISATDYDTSGLSYNTLYFTTNSTNTSNNSSRDLLNRLDTDTDGSSKDLSTSFGIDRDLSNIFGTGQDDNFETPVDKSARSKEGSKYKPQTDKRAISKRQIDSIFNTIQPQPLEIEKIKSSFPGKEIGSKSSFVSKDSQNTDLTTKCNTIVENSCEDDQRSNKKTTDEGDSNIENIRKVTSKDPPETVAKPSGHENQCEDITSGHENQCEDIAQIFLSISNISPSSRDSKNVGLESKSSDTGEKVSNIDNDNHGADGLPATIECFTDDRNESNTLLIKLLNDASQKEAEKIDVRNNKADSAVVSDNGEKVSNIDNNNHGVDGLPVTIECFDNKVTDDRNESNILLIKFSDGTCQKGAEKIDACNNKADSAVVLTDPRVDVSLGTNAAPVVNHATEKIGNNGENDRRLCGQNDETDEKKYTSQTIKSLKYLASKDSFSQDLTNLSQGTAEEKFLASSNGESSSSQVLTNLSFDNVEQNIYNTEQIFSTNESETLVEQIFSPHGSWTGSMNSSYISMDNNTSINIEPSNVKPDRSYYNNEFVNSKSPSKKDDLEKRRKLVGGISNKHWTGEKKNNNNSSMYHSNPSINSFDTLGSSMCLNENNNSGFEESMFWNSIDTLQEETFRGERKYGSTGRRFNENFGGSSFRQEQNRDRYDDDMLIRATVEVVECTKTAFDTIIDLLKMFNCLSKDTNIVKDKMLDKFHENGKYDGSDEKKKGIKEHVLKMIHQKHEKKNYESDFKSSKGFLNVMHLQERLSFLACDDRSMFGTYFVQKDECCGIEGSSDLSSGQSTNEETFNKICREKSIQRKLPEVPVRETIFEMGYVPANNISIRKHVQSVKNDFRLKRPTNLKRPLCTGPAKSLLKIRSTSPRLFKGGLKKVLYKKKVKGNLQKIEEESDHSIPEEHSNGKNLSAERKIGRRRISCYSPSRSLDKSKSGTPAEYLTKTIKKNLSPKNNWHLDSGSLSLACGAMEKPSFPSINITQKHKFNMAIQKINEEKDSSPSQNELNSSSRAVVGLKKGINYSRVRSYRKKTAVVRPMKITS